ncbi:aminopeptidase [Halosimplex marinum]|uniref:aminopeptidase n=1 Tax=Halosimplex marinum TaxID=3396620 RepID=UPI003F56BC13
MVDSDEGASGGESDDGRAGENPAYVDGVDGAGLVDASPNSLTLTPEQHERLKTRLHGDRLNEIQYSDRRYLVVGRGGDGGPGRRRRRVRDLLDDRRGATAFMLEDFGLSGDEIDLWAPAFEILCEQATHVVGVLGDFDGGHVWELGYLYHEQSRVRDALWLLKRAYESDERRRERYDNGMAAAHLAALERAAGDRVVHWRDGSDLRRAVGEIP